jgi:hypothetical protein
MPAEWRGGKVLSSIAKWGGEKYHGPTVKPIRLTKHAREQCAERGATEAEVVEAIRNGAREPAKNGREMFRFNFSFGRQWNNNHYAIKQVAPVVKDEANEIVVITVYTFYF